MKKASKTKIVVFFDDNAASPFWEAGEHRRAGFSDNDWGTDWDLKPFASPGDPDDSWTERFRSAISDITSQSKVYVVTDANFGDDPHGGTSLLEKLVKDSVLERGVVFSTALPRDGTTEYPNICAIRDDRTIDVASKIRRFLETGQTPAPDPETQIQALSRSIHQLENLVLPLRLDVETLKSRGTEPHVVEAIWEDYFSPPKEPEKHKEFLVQSKDCGFLLPNRIISHGTPGIENEIVRVLESLRSVPRVTACERWKALDTKQGLSPETVAKAFGIGAARMNSDSLKGNPDDLKRNLTEVRDEVLALARELRGLRNHLEAEEGGQP